MAGVGGEALDIAPLALSKESIKSQTGFAGTGDTGKDDELGLGKLERDILKIVLPGTSDDDFVGHKPTPSPPLTRRGERRYYIVTGLWVLFGYEIDKRWV